MDKSGRQKPGASNIFMVKQHSNVQMQRMPSTVDIRASQQVNVGESFREQPAEKEVDQKRASNAIAANLFNMWEGDADNKFF